MVTGPQALGTLDDLRQYVNKTLCEHESLEPGAFRLSEQLLVRGGQPCGLYFCLHGPRAVLYSAIWETQRNTILFYDSSGSRFLKTQLAAAPRIHGSVRPPAVATA